jgi:hypothetical protein
MTKRFKNSIGLRDALRYLVAESPGLTAPQIAAALPQFNAPSVLSSIVELVRLKQIYAVGPKRFTRFYQTEQAALLAADAVNAEIAAHIEATRKAQQARQNARRKVQRKATAPSRAKAREAARAKRRAEAEAKLQMMRAQAQARAAAEAQKKAEAKKPPPAKKKTSLPGAYLVVHGTRTDGRPPALRIPEPKPQREIIIPANVKRSYTPAPPGRFEVIGPCHGAGFADEWQRLRQSGA